MMMVFNPLDTSLPSNPPQLIKSQAAKKKLTFKSHNNPKSGVMSPVTSPSFGYGFESPNQMYNSTGKSLNFSTAMHQRTDLNKKSSVNGLN